MSIIQTFRELAGLKASPPSAFRTAQLRTTALGRVRLLGAEFDALNEEQCIAHMFGQLARRRGGWVVTPNLDILRQMEQDPELARLCGQADLCVADGMPLIWAAAFQGNPLPQRVTGSNLIWSASAVAAEQGYPIFLLGGHPGSAVAAAQILTRRFPKLQVCGTCCPPFGFEKDPAFMAALRQQLIEAKPSIVFVALGAPKQERLIADLRQSLPGAWWLGVGISFSFVCGQIHRAPAWMQAAGLEWFHRLLQEPRRLARRYLVHDLPFAFRLWGWALAQRLRLR